jgi:hypothetical protein
MFLPPKKSSWIDVRCWPTLDFSPGTTIPQAFDCKNGNKKTILKGWLFLFSTGGPDGIRTRDLGLDRAAC